MSQWSVAKQHCRHESMCKSQLFLYNISKGLEAVKKICKGRILAVGTYLLESFSYDRERRGKLIN